MGRFPWPALLLASYMSGCGAAPDASSPPERAGAAITRIVQETRARVRLRSRESAGAPAGAAAAAAPLRGTTTDGQPFDLAAWRGAPIVLLFYRGESCGLCLHRLQTLEHNLDGYYRLGARVAAVTVDPPESAARTAAGLGLRFAIITVDRAVLESWGVWPAAAPAPRPAAAILDAQGRIVYSHIGENAGDRVSDIELLAELARMTAPPAEPPHR